MWSFAHDWDRPKKQPVAIQESEIVRCRDYNGRRPHYTALGYRACGALDLGVHWEQRSDLEEVNSRRLLNNRGEGFSTADYFSGPAGHAFLTQAVHHPLALTSLPPNTLQGPSLASGLPEYNVQLPHTAVGSLRLLALVASIL